MDTRGVHAFINAFIKRKEVSTVTQKAIINAIK